MDSKLIDAKVLRSKVCQMIERKAHEAQGLPLSKYEQGFTDALGRVVHLIDKMQPVEAVKPAITMIQNGTGSQIAEMRGDMVINVTEKKTVTMTQQAKEIVNIHHIDVMEG